MHRACATPNVNQMASCVDLIERCFYLGVPQHVVDPAAEGKSNRRAKECRAQLQRRCWAGTARGDNLHVLLCVQQRAFEEPSGDELSLCDPPRIAQSLKWHLSYPAGSELTHHDIRGNA